MPGVRAAGHARGFTKVVPGRGEESLVLLALVVDHETSLRPRDFDVAGIDHTHSGRCGAVDNVDRV